MSTPPGSEPPRRHDPDAYDVEPPPAPVTEAGRAALRGDRSRGMQRMQALAAAVFVALFAVFALVISQGGRDNGASDERAPIRGIDDTATMLAGLPEREGVIGAPDAPVRIVEIVDLQCPHCAAHQIEVQPEVVDRLVRPGRAQLQLVSIGMLGEDSRRLRNVHERLTAKDLGWRFASLVLRNQGTPGTGWATDEYLRRVVAEIPGALDQDASPAADPAVARRVAETRRITRAIAAAYPAGRFGTPAFAIGRPGADPATYQPIRLDGDTSVLEALTRAVDDAAGRAAAR